MVWGKLVDYECGLKKKKKVGKQFWFDVHIGWIKQ
jgi:hypothetical protein